MEQYEFMQYMNHLQEQMDRDKQLTDDDRATIHGIVLQTTHEPDEAYFMTIAAEFAILHERAKNVKRISEQEVKIEQLQKHLNETDEALKVATNLANEFKERFEFAVADGHELRMKLEGYEDNECGTEDDLSNLVQRKDKLEEWLTEYRDHLKKVDFKEKQTLINEITELLND